MKAKIRLDTMRDVNEFVRICTGVIPAVHITDGRGLRVSAKVRDWRNLCYGVR